MPDATPSPTPEQPQQQQSVVIATGAISLLLGVAKIVAGLTTERALILFICVGAGWMFYTREKSQAEDKAQERRAADEMREREKQHCDGREDKIRRDSATDKKEMLAFYATQAELQRKFENEQQEKTRVTITELTRVIARKFPDKANDCPLPGGNP
jgi:uncharacterized protein HemX